MKEVVSVSGVPVKDIVAHLKKDGSFDKDVFMYLDPPYYPVTKNITRLYNGDYTPVDFLKLKLRCDELTINKIPFVLSNSDCEFIRVLFRDYPIVELNEPRGMKSGIGKGSRPPEKCLLITNFKNPDDLMKSIKDSGIEGKADEGK